MISVRIALARQHEGVGHARHGDVRVALAAAAAGLRGARQAAGKLVLQIAAQDAVLDQHIAPRGMPFVVHVQRAAPAGDGAVVDHGAQRAGHLLADASAEGRDALAVEIGFQAVPHGFMQQDAGPARTQHHGHLAGRRVHRVQHHDGLARGFGGEMLGRFFVQEEAELHASAAAGMAALRRAAVRRAPAPPRSGAPSAGGQESTPSLVATSTWRRLSA